MVTVLLETMPGRNSHLEEMPRKGTGVGVGTGLLRLPQVCHPPYTAAYLICSPSAEFPEPRCGGFSSKSYQIIMMDYIIDHW